MTLDALSLAAGTSFEYVFDLGDDWRHRCEVRSTDIDPEREYGVSPDAPVPIWGWGWIPDQCGRSVKTSSQQDIVENAALSAILEWRLGNGSSTGVAIVEDGRQHPLSVRFSPRFQIACFRLITTMNSCPFGVPEGER